MKQVYEYETVRLETYYALGKGDEFLAAYDVQEEGVSFCKEPKDACLFKEYDRAKSFLIDYPKMFEGFKVYLVSCCDKVEVKYQVTEK